MLARLLAENRPLLADGATGTNLFARGLLAGETPELWNVERPDDIASLARSFVDAGSDIVLTNTFGGNARRLMLHGLEGRVRELNARAAEIARGVVAASGREVVVAGSVGPTGDLLAPLGPLTEEEATEVFVAQIEGLREGGVDVVWIETMSAFEEMRAAAAAAARLDMPCTLTASFDTAGKTMMGLSPGAFALATRDLPRQPLAIGGNCGVGASDLLVSVLGVSAAAPEAIVIAKGNAGIPSWRGTEIHYSGTPERMADYARLAVDAGARIVGGCCGTSPEHVAAMARALSGYRAGERPEIAAIIARIGPLLAPQAAAQPETPRRARRRG